MFQRDEQTMAAGACRCRQQHRCSSCSLRPPFPSPLSPQPFRLPQTRRWPACGRPQLQEFFAGRPIEPYLSGRRKRNAMARNKLPRRTDGGTEARINNSGPRPAVSRFSSLPARCARRARINRRICLRSCSRHRSPGSSGQRPGRSPAATRSRE